MQIAKSVTDAPSPPRVETVPAKPQPVEAPPKVDPIPAVSIAPTVSTPPKQPQCTLAEQVGILDRARDDWKASRPDDALSEIDRYRAKCPHGELMMEALMIRIESLYARGDRDKARQEASAFLSAHPNNVYQTRLRDIAGDKK
jgi:hypothetical protein